MPTTLNRCPEAINICLTRGDTKPFGFTLLDEDGNARDLTGHSYELTVNTESDPSDATNEVFTVTGVVSSNTVSFNLSTSEADQLGTLFYDFQETDPSADIFTIAKGEIEWRQDINK